MQRHILNYIQTRVEPSSPPCKIRALVLSALEQKLSKLEAFEKLDWWACRALRQLEGIYCRLIEQGQDPWFELNSRSKEYIQGPCHVEPGDPNEVAVAKRQRSYSKEVMNILREVTFSDFEIVCAAILSLIGARVYRRTRRSADQGIDFFGELFLGDLNSANFPFFRFEDNLKVWIVGQAKHYPNGSVSTAEIRNLVGSINLARFKEFASQTELSSEASIRSCDPVFAIFMTTGQYTKDSTRLSDRSGVIIKDIDSISRLIADNGVSLDENGTPTRATLIDWARKMVGDITCEKEKDLVPIL